FGVAMVRQPLTIWRMEDARSTIGGNTNWRTSLSWIRKMRTIISPRAYSWFIAIQCVWRARASHAGLFARLGLLNAFLLEGSPEFRSFLSFLAFALIPAPVRRS